MAEKGKILYFEPSADRESIPASEDAVESAMSPKEALVLLAKSVEECGQDPVTQLFGYFITEDPTYLPDEGQARTLARRVGRDKLLCALIDAYMED